MEKYTRKQRVWCRRPSKVGLIHTHSFFQNTKNFSAPPPIQKYCTYSHREVASFTLAERSHFIKHQVKKHGVPLLFALPLVTVIHMLFSFNYFLFTLSYTISYASYRLLQGVSRLLCSLPTDTLIHSYTFPSPFSVHLFLACTHTISKHSPLLFAQVIYSHHTEVEEANKTWGGGGREAEGESYKGPEPF